MDDLKSYLEDGMTMEEFDETIREIMEERELDRLAELDHQRYMANGYAQVRAEEEEGQRLLTQRVEQAELEDRKREEAQKIAAREAAEARQRKIDERIAAAFPDPNSDPSMQLTEEEYKQYQQNLPVFGKVASYYAANVTNRLKDEFRNTLSRNEELQSRLDEMEARIKRAPKEAMHSRVLEKIPDFETIIRDPNFIRYRDTPIEGLGITPGDLLRQHHERGNTKGFIDIMERYRNQSPTSTRKPQQQSYTPNRSTSSPRPESRRAKMLRASDLDMAYMRHEAGQLSDEKLQKIIYQFDLAAADGRVDYDH